MVHILLSQALVIGALFVYCLPGRGFTVEGKE